MNGESIFDLIGPDPVPVRRRPARRRPTSHRLGGPARTRIRSTVWKIAAPILAGVAAVAAIVLAPGTASANRDAERYAGAPRCVADTRPASDCVWSTSALVTDVTLKQHSGKKADGYDTRVLLTVDDSAGFHRIAAVTLPGDHSTEIPVDQPTGVLVWEGDITGYTLRGADHETADNPHSVLHAYLVWQAVTVGVAALLGRISAWQLWHFRLGRVNPRRFDLPDFALILLVGTVVGLAVGGLAVACAAISVLTVGVLVASATAWPLSSWVQRRSPQPMAAPSEPAPHPDWDMSKRPAAQKLW